MHRIRNKEMILYVSHSMARLKLEKTIILCYTIFDSVRIEVLKRQDKIKRQNKNRQIIKAKNSRREVTAYETQ